MSFDEWFNELEGFGLRSERVPDSVDIEWLKAAYKQGLLDAVEMRIAELRECPFCGCGVHISLKNGWYVIGGDHAANCVLLSEKIRYVDRGDEGQMLVADWNTRADQWLDINEHQPPIGVYVLVANDAPQPFKIGTFDVDGNFKMYRGLDDLGIERPTHWMPIPKVNYE